MTIGSVDMLDHAFELYEQGDKSEVVRRVIIGRAYYALFHMALELAASDLKIDLTTIEASTHSRLFQGLKTYPTKDYPFRCKLQSLSRDLKRLHSIRVAADYYLHKTVTQKQVELMLMDAKRLTDAIVELQEAVAA